MLLDDAASDLLKKWIVKKLEDISDADSDVLADYVLALVKTDEPAAVARTNCIESLRDFVPNNTDSFVNELFQAIATKSYDPNKPALKPTAPAYQPLKRGYAEPPRVPNESRKRSRQDWDREESMNGNGAILNYESDGRPLKQAKKGGRGRANRGGRHQQSLGQIHRSPQNTRLDHPMPFAMPLLDPNNPADAIRVMQEAMDLLANMRRCQEYYTKGFCTAGPSCPYEHEEPYVMPNQQYDPANAALSNIQPSRVGKLDVLRRERGGGRGRGRGRGTSHWRGGGKRAEFSHVGPNRDLSIREIVVEQIPDGKCDEKAVRDFFVQFGQIEEIKLYPQNKLAIVKFETHEAAKSAYDSPKVVFDNRFVKIYWYKPAKNSELAHGTGDHDREAWQLEDVEMGGAESMDEQEFAERQEEAQRKHEELTKQREEAEKQKEEVTAKLLKMEAERKKVEAVLAKKAGKSDTASADSLTATSTEDNEQTKALKAQLAQLEAQAKSLGIDPDAPATNGFSGHPSYPSYRGRASYRGRGRGRAHYRGYGGRWDRGGAVMRLDNRPKTVAVTFADGSYDDYDEAIRQFLLFNSLDSATITKHPDRDDTALVAFTQRYEGENFMGAIKSELPHVGKVELSWYKAEEQSALTNGNHDKDEDRVVIPVDPPSSPLPDAPDAEQAYDNVEEDLDRFS